MGPQGSSYKKHKGRNAERARPSVRRLPCRSTLPTRPHTARNCLLSAPNLYATAMKWGQCPSRFHMSPWPSSDRRLAPEPQWWRLKMAHSISADQKCPDLTRNADYRCYRVARSAPPSGHRFGRTHGRRAFAHARRAARRAVAFLRIIHLAIVAAKIRRLDRELALHGAHYDPQNDTTILRGGGPPIF
jgi:hypothetical protein